MRCSICGGHLTNQRCDDCGMIFPPEDRYTLHHTEDPNCPSHVEPGQKARPVSLAADYARHRAESAPRFWQRRCRAAAAGAVLKPQGGNCAVLPQVCFFIFCQRNQKPAEHHKKCSAGFRYIFIYRISFLNSTSSQRTPAPGGWWPSGHRTGPGSGSGLHRSWLGRGRCAPRSSSRLHRLPPQLWPGWAP